MARPQSSTYIEKILQKTPRNENLRLKPESRRWNPASGMAQMWDGDYIHKLPPVILNPRVVPEFLKNLELIQDPFKT